ncbi:glycosyltransferase family 4 protein [Klebsiella pneumoniae]|nr:glycosyltransferase family 4 protein [Klebsiella pneumoniae]
MRKEVYIDTRWEGAGGIGTFTREIQKINNYKSYEFHGNPASPLDTLRTSFSLFREKDILILFPGYIPPLLTSVPFVFTIHDLNHLDRVENSSFLKRLFYNTVIKYGCKRAEYIFTVSDFSKQRIISWANISSDKVINVGNGVSMEYTPTGDMIGFDFDFILCVSNRKGHKNEYGTLEAFKKAMLDKKIKLVFTGDKDENISKKIYELGLEDRVVFTGFLPDIELPKLYRSAKALIFVSFYEGFGLPVIEAQASGIPVITSKGSSLGEVASEGALLVEPTDIDEISKAITTVFKDNKLSSELVQKGFENVKRYTWEKTALLVEEYLSKI